MKLKVYSFLFLSLFITGIGLAQHTLRGRVLEKTDQRPVDGCSIYLKGSRNIYFTDSTGHFAIPNLKPGTYQLQLFLLNHRPLRTEVTVGPETPVTEFLLESTDKTLNEVVVTAQQGSFGMTRLREVEGTAIFAAKKSEVILPENLVANLATNNARQVYARVAGLNIWENDGGGLQLSIGGRGLDPNRTSNFNVRQNGYDISADALGYPESYYTPPVEALKRIKIVRGAASLQYGTQFGGLLNFEMRQPVTDRTLEVVSRQTVGSFGFFNSFNSVSGTAKKLSYYAFFQYKRGDGWRPNSHFDNKTIYGDIHYQLTDKALIGLEVTHMDYLARQPGGLSDVMFRENPRQSNRERNWFKVDWNLFNLHYDWKLNRRSEVNVSAFGLLASRSSLGFRPNRVATVDNENIERDLIVGDFRNWGLEARFLNRYKLGRKDGVFLVGTRYYHGFNHSRQGEGPRGKGADFTFVEPDQLITYDYRFPNRNVSLFAENVLFLSDKVSVTPGVRYEYIRTTADGFYGNIVRDLAGNIITVSRTKEVRTSPRGFLIAGIGLSYKPSAQLEAYANISQNYRSITFNDMRISNPSAVIDPNMKDERGFSADAGIRGEKNGVLNYDLSLFLLNYNNRIGEVQFYDESDRVLRKRGNIGQALIMGVESYGEVELLRLLQPTPGDWGWSVFGNVALIRSDYVKSQIPGVKGNQVEFVPAVNLKTGMRGGYRNFKASFQFTYLSDQYSDATNAVDGGFSAVVGRIPAYHIMDASVSWQHKWLKIEGSVNNLTNAYYFTRRATGYPGPGILPSDGRSFFLTVGVKW
ncbi:TonB-dependent receptor [Larkinella soli]|uniref:TonB-dependent receptor n=1 Tax=Larkinella soli TaxID=1770527 RepID=UPI000FFB24F2|nr:TonB-dependent receptor [Larkinella soli]